MNRLTLARPYARAAFESAKAGDGLAAWLERLQLSAALASAEGIRVLLGNPALDGAQLVALILPPAEPADSAFARFLGTLAANRRLPLLPEVLQLFAELKHAHEQTRKVTVRTAAPIDEAQAESLRAALKRRFAQEIAVEAVVDPTLIGGAVIDAGDVVIDGSVRGRLAQLRGALVE